MGFSVSGSAAIIFLAAFISVGTLYTTAYNSFEQVNEAEHAVNENVLERHNTEIEVTNVLYDATNDTLTVTVRNRGSTVLEVNATDVLVDGVYEATWRSWNVSGQTDTDIWLPGETLNVTVTAANASRVKVVSGPGVTDAEAI